MTNQCCKKCFGAITSTQKTCKNYNCPCHTIDNQSSNLRKDAKIINKEDWEKEFNKKWYLFTQQNYSYVTCGEEVKSFIQSLLSQQKEEIISGINELAGDPPTWSNEARREYWRAIEEIKSLITKL